MTRKGLSAIGAILAASSLGWAGGEPSSQAPQFSSTYAVAKVLAQGPTHGFRVDHMYPSQAQTQSAQPFQAATAPQGAFSDQPGDPEHPRLVPTLAPISAAGRTGLLPIKFTRNVSSITGGDLVGTMQGGWSCTKQGNYYWTEKLATEVEARFASAVNKRLPAAGYSVVKANQDIFFASTAPSGQCLDLGLKVDAVQMRICFNGNMVKGEAYFKVTWALFDSQAQRVVAEMPGEGSYQDLKGAVDASEILAGAADAVVCNLLAREDFIRALQKNSSPLPEAQVASDSGFTFARIAPPAGGLVKNGTQLRAAVVTIRTSEGNGSGFYISRNGYLLTNQHVVGDAKFLTVITATGRELPGEVLAVDGVRDVALVKTAKTPFEPIALKLTDPTIGEDVYVIGTPIAEAFNGTMTRGILSGFRDLSHRRYLQSDVSVTHGSSGGPLLDAQGNAIGIVVLGSDMVGGNFNLFIPIADALAKLAIKIQ